MYFIKENIPTTVLVEAEAYEGVYRIAQKVALDFEKVCGQRPQIIRGHNNCPGASLILFATLGKSPIVDALVAAGKLDVSGIEGKWECYLRTVISNPFPGIEELTVICGSDKRGTIYGMFSLSEYLGVTPLCYWGDAEPMPRTCVVLGADWSMISKEPSVKFRGFFINDEWPCFGRWTREKFGDVNADAYEVIFEFLLRMKGNYLWPAMWCSNFPLDGPGSLNEELADMYGVVIGFSHHEPCLRAGGEYSRVRGASSPYGDEWSFLTNREGITNFWRDGLLRSGKYENLITIGMRGEADSTILGENSGLKENIDLLKDVITVQKQLIRECCGDEKADAQQLLAIYKEVEPFFYGDETVAGLKDWDGLENVICMLCEDNYGFLRSLPSKELYQQITSRGGGFGMYYHLDYHGAPTSYEWMPCTPLPKIWDQMCMAYDYGVRDAWIVNVGDVKGNVFELEYFLTLAYDYDTWGSSAPNSWKHYLEQKLTALFPALTEQLRQDIQKVYTDYMTINALRRPEAVNENTFHPCHYLEADRLLQRITACEQLADSIWQQLQESSNIRGMQTYYSLFYYPEQASMNLYKMWLYTVKNHHYASQGRVIANTYAGYVKECLQKDVALGKKFAAFREGKWNGMELETHIGFRSWNEDGCRYPICHIVEPYEEPRLSVSRKDSSATAIRAFGGPKQIIVDDFLDGQTREVTLELANTGIDLVDYEIQGSASWLELSDASGCLSLLQELHLTYHPERMTLDEDRVILTIRSTKSRLVVEHKPEIQIVVSACKKKELLPRTAYPRKGLIAIDAPQYYEKHCRSGAEYVELEGYGRSGFGMKVFPNTASYTMEEEAPSLRYRFAVDSPGQYEAEFWLTPTSPVLYQGAHRLALQLNDGTKQAISLLPETYRAGDWRDSVWSKGVMDHIRKVTVPITCDTLLNTLTISALDAGVILERILIYPKDNPPLDSYLGI